MTVRCMLAVCSMSVLPSAQSPTSSGKLTDRAGDVRPSTTMPKPPDLLSATIDVFGGNLTVSFAPGSLSDKTILTIYLDLDEDAKTGLATPLSDSSANGADYVISGLSPHNPARAGLSQKSGRNGSTFRGLLDVVRPAPDQLRIVVPLSRLGDDDGRMKFAVGCSHLLSTTPDGNQTIASHVDVMPDRGEAPGAVR